jgi:hypothetical protein
LFSLAFLEAEMIDPRREYLGLMRRMPFAEAERLHNDFGVPWASIAATVPVPTRVRFADKAQTFFEPDERGRAAWVIPATCVDPVRPEEIEVVDPLDVVSTGPIVDLVCFHPHCRARFALRTGAAVVLGVVPPQYMQPDRVPVFNDVADWLKSGCNGIVLLTNDAHQRGRILRRIESIEAQDPARVKAALELPEWPRARPTRSVFAMAA